DTVDGDTSSISALLSDPGTDGEVSLREAVIAANNTAGDDTIHLTGGETYSLTLTGSEEDDSETGDLDIKDNGEIVIQTVGNGTATIDAGGINGLDDRVFEIQSNGSLKLERLQITGGLASGLSPSGGAILVNSDANLELTQSILTGNEASSGGAIFNDSGEMSIDRSIISGNTTSLFLPSRGGGIVNDHGVVTITQTTISNNSSDSLGAGILNVGGDNFEYATLNIDNSTISGNITPSAGGGIFNTGGIVNINNSTVSGNSANIGGGIDNRWYATANITNSTITDNSGSYYAGVYNYDVAVVGNTIIAGNESNRAACGGKRRSCGIGASA
ncbi:MAG: hypothetical protein F6K17_41240, partial [Okeania sp. SIO3C4]|nr:hypothetical protein [Okeania sp. SIO3C4]